MNFPLLCQRHARKAFTNSFLSNLGLLERLVVVGFLRDKDRDSSYELPEMAETNQVNITIAVIGSKIS
jgi:hypothetical protein